MPPVPSAITGTAPAALADGPHLLRCEGCDVTWRGSSTAPCWCCGASGAIMGEARIFAD